jgi:hypothetical protein
MGEATAAPLRVDFDRRIKLEFHSAKFTSDGGLLAYRELDGALELTDMTITKLLDGRRGKNTRHKLSGLFWQSVFGRLAATRMSTTTSGSPATPRCGRSSAVRVSIVRPLRAARWAASRPSGWRPTPT